MKKFTIFISIVTLSISFNSCRLFQGGGSGGGHCPAYGSSIENDHLLKDINNEFELRQSMSESM